MKKFYSRVGKISIIITLFFISIFISGHVVFIDSNDNQNNSSINLPEFQISPNKNTVKISNQIEKQTYSRFIKMINSSISEAWETRYRQGNGMDEGTSIAVDGLGNVYVTGLSVGLGTSSDYATIKYNSAGVQQWVARYNGPGNDWDLATSLAVDGSGNVYVTGISFGLGTSSDYATIKYNSAGVQQWVARYNGPGNGWDNATSLAVDGSGNVYVTGESMGTGTGTDYATIKYNSMGVQQWVARYNGPGNSSDIATSIAVDDSGNVFITGASLKSGMIDNDYATIKYNSAGNQQWVTRYNGPGNSWDWANSLAVDGSGNVYVTGESVGSGTYSDYATIKYNSGGVQQWVSRYNGPGNYVDIATAITVDDVGNVYVTGESSGISTSSDYATIKYNSSGIEQWVKRYNGPGNDYDEPSDISVDGFGNVYVTGESSGISTSSDYATIKYNSSGIEQWVKRYNGPGNGGDFAKSLAVDGSGNVYVTGGSYDSSHQNDIATIKYNSNGAQQWVVRYDGNTNPGNSATLISPINSTINSLSINFQWSNSGAVRYELLVDNDSSFNSPEISRHNINDLKNYTATSFEISGNWLQQNVYYWKVISFFANGTSTTSNVGTFTYEPTKIAAPHWGPVYRAYHQSYKDHFYCTSERHLSQAVERGYNFERVEGYVSLFPFESSHGMKDLFRFYLTRDTSHFYTTNPSQKDSLIKADTTNIYEGIIGYTYSNHPDMVRFYHTYLAGPNSDHFYTTSEFEKNNSILNNFEDRGYIAYLSIDGDNGTESWMDMQPVFGYGINPQNGNFGHYNKTSFNIPGARSSLEFTHMYNSYSAGIMSMINPLGPGWSHNYNAQLYKINNRIIIFWPGGNIHIYNATDFKPITPGVYDELTKVFNFQYQIKKKDQTIFLFSLLNDESDSTFFLTSIRDKNDNVTMLNYDHVNRKLASVRSPENRLLIFSYYPEVHREHLIREVEDPIGRKVRFEYDNDFNLIKFNDAKSQNTIYKYDTTARYDHLLHQIIFPKGNIITNLYSNKKIVSQKKNNDAFLNVDYQLDFSRIVDQSGKQYDAYYSSPVAGLITRLQTSSGNVEYTYNDNNNKTLPTSIKDGKGFITTFSYDSRGNVLQANRPNSVLHRFNYNDKNDVTKYIDPRNKETNYSYDSKGNLTSVQNPRGTTSITYNPKGTINSITNPVNIITSLSYNSYGNVTTQRINSILTKSYSYDAVSRITSSTDENGRMTSYTYDNNDLLISTSFPIGSASYQYDANNNLFRVTDPKGFNTTFNHNSMDLLGSVSNPVGNQTSFDYHDNSLLKSKTKPSGGSVNYTYDNSNRLTNISGGISGTISYDNNDNITSISDANGSMSFSYDALNRLTSYTDYFGNIISYGYDAADNITSITYPGNKVVNYTYYDDNLMHTVRDWNNQTTTYLYRNDGSLNEVLYPNGSRKIYTYDNFGRVTGVENLKNNGSIINNYSFTLDNVGNHIAVNQTEPFTLQNLTSFSNQYSYNNANRLINDGYNSYSFNANGNMTNKTGYSYSYDIENRLISITGNVTANFGYDLFGNRRRSNINGNERRYIVDINKEFPSVLMETNQNGTVQNYYVYGLELISRIKPNGTTTYYHSDYRGSVVAKTNNSNQITHKYQYGPFGELWQKDEQDYNPFRYVGTHGIMDDETGLYFMRARYYDVSAGRFISEDPIWDINLYPYVENNPIIYFDPNGEDKATIAHNILIDITYGHLAVVLHNISNIGLNFLSWAAMKLGFSKASETINSYKILSTPFISSKDAAHHSTVLYNNFHKIQLNLIDKIKGSRYFEKNINLNNRYQ